MRIFIGNENIDNSYDKVYNSIEEISSLEPSSVTHVECMVLDNIADRNQGIKLMLSKLRYGGRLSLIGVDVNLVSLALINGQLNVESLSNIMYKDKRSISSLMNMISIFNQIPGIKVMNAFTENLEYILTVERDAHTHNS